MQQRAANIARINALMNERFKAKYGCENALANLHFMGSRLLAGGAERLPAVRRPPRRKAAPSAPTRASARIAGAAPSRKYAKGLDSDDELVDSESESEGSDSSSSEGEEEDHAVSGAGTGTSDKAGLAAGGKGTTLKATASGKQALERVVGRSRSRFETWSGQRDFAKLPPPPPGKARNLSCHCCTQCIASWRGNMSEPLACSSCPKFYCARCLFHINGATSMDAVYDFVAKMQGKWRCLHCESMCACQDDAIMAKVKARKAKKAAYECHKELGWVGVNGGYTESDVKAQESSREVEKIRKAARREARAAKKARKAAKRAARAAKEAAKEAATQVAAPVKAPAAPVATPASPVAAPRGRGVRCRAAPETPAETRSHKRTAKARCAMVQKPAALVVAPSANKRVRTAVQKFDPAGREGLSDRERKAAGLCAEVAPNSMAATIKVRRVEAKAPARASLPAPPAKRQRVRRAAQRFDPAGLDGLSDRERKAAGLVFPPRIDFNDNRLSALRTVPHAEEDDVWVLEGRTATGAWLPVSSFPERDVAGWPSVWVTLSEVVDEDVVRSSTLLWREESLGTKVLRTFPGGTTIEAVVVEFDLPACLKKEASYYIVHADGDDEDIGEGEFERDRQAYLKYRQSARP